MFLCKSLVYRYGTTILCKGDDFMIFCDKTRVDKEQNTPFHLDLFRLQGGESNSCISEYFVLTGLNSQTNMVKLCNVTG